MITEMSSRGLGCAALVAIAACALHGCQSAEASLAPLPPPIVSTTDPIAEPPPFKDVGIRSQGRRIPVIMWHNVVPSERERRAWFDVTKSRFIEQLETLRRDGWTPISLDALHGHLTNGEPVPQKAVVLTFDDAYQGFFDNAYPILKERKLPAAMFVHTGYVGDKRNSPKMGWTELETLVRDGLVSIGSHTVSHPEDITRLYSDEIRRELEESKKALESRLKIEVKDFAYPVGKNNEAVRQMVKDAGYRMAFTTDPGPAEESPGILAVNRWIETKFEEACRSVEDTATNAPASVVEIPLRDQAIEVRNEVIDGRRFTLIVGGKPRTWLSAGRFTVGKIVSLAGAKAGVNGGYFALSALQSDDTQMIGPCLTSNQKVFRPDKYEPRLPKLANRPIIALGPDKMAIFPFQPGVANTEAQIRAFMPDATDVFMAGAWFVRNGIGRTWDELQVYCAKDVNDHRRRAFFGTMADGRTMIGASISSLRTEQLGKILAKAGVQEAVLLDSGYSTSLVLGDQVLASGHSTPDKPSRPIPHSILLFSELPPAEGNVGVLSEIAAERRSATQGGLRRR